MIQPLPLSTLKTQRTQTFTRRLLQWGRVPLTVTLIVLGMSIAQGNSVASPKHAAPPSFPEMILPIARHPDIHSNHQILLSETLRALPKQCQANLRNLYIRYDHPNQRGLAGKGTIVLNGNVEDTELRALFIHEFGHITDLGCLRGTPGRGPSPFHDGPDPIFKNDPSTDFYSISWIQETTQKPENSPADFVSGYAAKDAFEDFAETFAYAMLQPEAFRTRAHRNKTLQKKLLWMQEHVFQNHQTIASGKPWNGMIPWDVTKIPFTWQKNVYSPYASAKHPRRIVARK